MILINGTVTLTCDGCGRERTYDGGALLGDLPVVEWWIRQRQQRCAECFALEVGVLDDPDRNAVKVRRDARSTSTSAASKAFPRSGTQRRRVLACIAESVTGRTDDEIITNTRLPHQSVGPRRLELLEGGWIEDSQARRITRAGSRAIVWTVTAAGRSGLS